MNRPLCWSINEVGIFTGTRLGISTVGGLIAAPLLKRCLSDILVATLAALSAALTNVYKFFVINSLMMYLC